MSVCMFIRLVDGFVVVGIDVIYFHRMDREGGMGDGCSLQFGNCLRILSMNYKLIVVVDGDDINAESFLRMCC